MLLFNYKINELWIIAVVQVNRMCIHGTHTFFIKNRADSRSALRLKTAN